jgi:cyclic pyranopterin phosphate synthase
MTEFSHIDKDGRVRMVDVSAKTASLRKATAQGEVRMRAQTLESILANRMKKGNVLETARIAGVMAAKRTAELIPMCHPLNISHAQVDFFPEPAENRIRVTASVRLVGATGVEMEALTAVSVACLTIYDMCKAVDREMIIDRLCLTHKSGGKSGTFERHAPPAQIG